MPSNNVFLLYATDSLSNITFAVIDIVNKALVTEPAGSALLEILILMPIPD